MRKLHRRRTAELLRKRGMVVDRDRVNWRRPLRDWQKDLTDIDREIAQEAMVFERGDVVAYGGAEYRVVRFDWDAQANRLDMFGQVGRNDPEVLLEPEDCRLVRDVHAGEGN